MSWAAWLAVTKTGRLGPRLPLLGGSKATVELNTGGSSSIVTEGDWIDTIPLRWWYPWAASIIVAHRTDGLDADWRPVLLGPITDFPACSMTAAAGESGQPVTLTGGDLRDMLARRIITGPADWDGTSGTWALQHTAVRYERMSLGTIADRIIDLATARRAGSLPIRHRQDLSQTGLAADDGHARQYNAHNLGNNDVDKRLSELSDVIGGPDIMLRPGIDWGDSMTPPAAYATVVHGVEGQPQMPQRRALVWDATRPAGPVMSIAAAVDASQMWTRRWATGDGQDADILMDVRQNEQALQAGMPLMEDVTVYQSVTTHATLLAHVDALIAAGQHQTVQWTATVDLTHPDASPGVWHVGDRVRVITPPTRAYAALTEKSAQAPWPPRREDRDMTIIKAAFSLSSETATVDLQEDADNA